VEQLYSEPRPQRKWLRIPLDRPIFTGITLGILLAFYIPVMLSEETANALYGFGWKENSLIVEGEWWRLVTSTLLHGPLYHIFFNGYALFMLGSDLESFFNRWRFLAIYWVSALGGSVASFAFSPVPSVGASGAIFGLIGALAVYFGLHRGLFGRIGQAQFWNIIVVIVLNVGIGLSRIFPIDNAAHIGGLVVGAAAGYVLCPRYALSDWRFPNVRDIKDTNRGSLTWIAFTLIALDVIFAFFVALLMYQKGYWTL
jgi:rhomboid protease GluP